MTDPNTRSRLVDLSVIATSALVLGGAMLVVADFDRSRPQTPLVPETTASSVGVPPASGLLPAPLPARRVVVVRRSRAS
jgi:hypothetical protein